MKLRICAEKGEVLSEHYKLLPVDLRDLQKLDDIVTLANIDPRYLYFIFCLMYILRKYECGMNRLKS